MSSNKKFQNKYRIPSARWAQWDYGWNGTYFITICTQDRLHHFGEISRVSSRISSPVETQYFASLQQNTMNLSELGIQAQKCAIDIPQHFPFVTIDTFVVMPNHVHLLFTICKPDDQINGDNSSCDSTNINGSCVETQNFASLQPHGDQPMNQFGPQSKNVASIVRGFKIGVTNFAHIQTQNIAHIETQNIAHIETQNIAHIETQNIASLPKFKWQPRYHDHIVRNEEEYFRILNYINNNINRWDEDTFNTIN